MIWGQALLVLRQPHFHAVDSSRLADVSCIQSRFGPGDVLFTSGERARCGDICPEPALLAGGMTVLCSVSWLAELLAA